MAFEEKEKITIEDLKSGDFIQFKNRNSTYVVVKTKLYIKMIPVYLERNQAIPKNEIIERVFSNTGTMRMRLKEENNEIQN